MKLGVATSWPNATPSFDAERAAETAEVIAATKSFISEVRIRVAVRAEVMKRRNVR